MLGNCRVRRYQEFLKTLRRPEPRVCLCPLHLHPRPWIHPPCRSSRATAMERRAGGRKRSDHHHYNYHHHHHHDCLDQLQQETKLLEEAQKIVTSGEPLPKDMVNTVLKWSGETHKSENTEDVIPEGGAGRETSTQGRRKKEKSTRNFEEEEEALRQELKNVRELTHNNIYLLEENRRLARKVQRLRQRARQQGRGEQGSKESGQGEKQDDIFASLKKKYEDLLQYVLKVETENQKLNSLLRTAENKSSTNNNNSSDEAKTAVKSLHQEMKILKEQLNQKDENLIQYEQQIKALRSTNMELQETLRRHSPGREKRSDASELEEEWMRRLGETKEIYEEAIQGYKEQLQQTQRKIVENEEEYTKQLQEMDSQLEEMRETLEAEERNKSQHNVTLEELQRKLKEGKRRTVEVSGIDYNHGENDNEQPTQPEARQSEDQESHVNRNITCDSNSIKNLPVNTHRESKKNTRDTQTENYPQVVSTGQREEEGKELDPLSITSAAYTKALEHIIIRLENMQVGGEEVENIVKVIKSTINTSLLEWSNRFQADKAQRNGENNNQQEKIEELQRKVKGKNKKIESLEKQVQDYQTKNERLVHRSSLLESQTLDQLGILSDLPQKLQLSEQQLSECKEVLHRAQADNQALQSQINHLEEKLGRKESKLKAEREQREKEAAGMADSISSLHRQLEEVSKEMEKLREQACTKDVILEHTSEQLKERIKECASLNAMNERYKTLEARESERVENQPSERETALHRQLLEAQTQLSALHAEKERSEKTLRSTVRRLEEQMDQLQLRNSTLQRQLTTFTSTYHSLFSSVDLQPITIPLPTTTNI